MLSRARLLVGRCRLRHLGIRSFASQGGSGPKKGNPFPHQYMDSDRKGSEFDGEDGDENVVAEVPVEKYGKHPEALPEILRNPQAALTKDDVKFDLQQHEQRLYGPMGPDGNLHSDFPLEPAATFAHRSPEDAKKTSAMDTLVHALSLNEMATEKGLRPPNWGRHIQAEDSIPEDQLYVMDTARNEVEERYKDHPDMLEAKLQEYDDRVKEEEFRQFRDQELTRMANPDASRGQLDELNLLKAPGQESEYQAFRALDMDQREETLRRVKVLRERYQHGLRRLSNVRDRSQEELEELYAEEDWSEIQRHLELADYRFFNSHIAVEDAENVRADRFLGHAAPLSKESNDESQSDMAMQDLVQPIREDFLKLLTGFEFYVIKEKVVFSESRMRHVNYMVAGNHNGALAWARGVGNSPVGAEDNAIRKLYKNMVFVPRKEGRTFYQNSYTQFNGCKVILKEGGRGHGPRGGIVMRKIMQLLGMEDFTIKVLNRHRNLSAMMYALFEGLRSQVSDREGAENLGLHYYRMHEDGYSRPRPPSREEVMTHQDQVNRVLKQVRAHSSMAARRMYREMEGRAVDAEAHTASEGEEGVAGQSGDDSGDDSAMEAPYSYHFNVSTGDENMDYMDFRFGRTPNLNDPDVVDDMTAKFDQKARFMDMVQDSVMDEEPSFPVRRIEEHMDEHYFEQDDNPFMQYEDWWRPHNAQGMYERFRSDAQPRTETTRGSVPMD